MNEPVADHRLFLSHWMGLRGADELMPTSETFLDKPNPLFAPNILVLDIHDEDFVIRLQATELVERWGVDLTGRSMFSSPLPMNRSDMLRNVDRLMRQPCGLLSVHRTKTSGGRKLLMETLGLPLATLPGNAPRLVNYSWLIDPLEDGEHSEKVTVYERQQWIDIGAGVPSEKPLKPMTP